MNILLHICCGPCAIFPLEEIHRENYSVEGYFFNPNIHPFKEFQRRLDALEKLQQETGTPITYHREYGLKTYLQQVVFREERPLRCEICYEMRLTATAARAREAGADAFSSTLLYSRYQNHDVIRQIGEKVAVQHGIPFYYRDFRKGWQRGIDMAIAMGLYRQPYCGCIYSEQERYDRRTRQR